MAIARAIVADPTLLVCDEPTGDLDRETAEEILEPAAAPEPRAGQDGDHGHPRPQGRQLRQPHRASRQGRAWRPSRRRRLREVPAPHLGGRLAPAGARHADPALDRQRLPALRPAAGLRLRPRPGRWPTPTPTCSSLPAGSASSSRCRSRSWRRSEPCQGVKSAAADRDLPWLLPLGGRADRARFRGRPGPARRHQPTTDHPASRRLATLQPPRRALLVPSMPGCALQIEGRRRMPVKSLQWTNRDGTQTLAAGRGGHPRRSQSGRHLRQLSLVANYDYVDQGRTSRPGHGQHLSWCASTDPNHDERRSPAGSMRLFANSPTRPRRRASASWSQD